MNLPGFYLKIISVFNLNKVKYLLIGGHAVNFYGYVRVTADMDIWVSNESTNLEKLFKSLLELGYNEENCKKALDFFMENHMIKIPKDTDLVELLDSFMVKTDFESAYKNRETANIDGIKINIIGFNELIKSKTKSNRDKDLNDVKELQEIKKIIDDKKSGQT